MTYMGVGLKFLWMRRWLVTEFEWQVCERMAAPLRVSSASLFSSGKFVLVLVSENLLLFWTMSAFILQSVCKQNPKKSWIPHMQAGAGVTRRSLSVLQRAALTDDGYFRDGRSSWQSHEARERGRRVWGRAEEFNRSRKGSLRVSIAAGEKKWRRFRDLWATREESWPRFPNSLKAKMLEVEKYCFIYYSLAGVWFKKGEKN